MFINKVELITEIAHEMKMRIESEKQSARTKSLTFDDN